ncbi:hypothetical protein AVEN_205524-1 [Araneus ventricosus]|uniref:Uncharacterized protein n=1 Tax=Araneus ventricosus TaxID=182803 RepID=A0A4Y2M8I6_ARAVE|nr:hypothetical protein AVEN_205524-1 [Araneus ventricosus]
MKLKILVPFFLLLALVRSQTHQHRSYDWRTSGRIQEWPKFSSLSSFEHQAATESYPVKEDFRRYPEPSPFLDSSFSSDFQNVPYVDQSISVSYDSYGEEPRQQLNMTTARIGGFAGSGDTRGYGAYDFPKNHHPEPLDHPEPEPYDEIPSGHPHMHRELSDLLRINRNHHSGHPDPMFMHPLPPPL